MAHKKFANKRDANERPIIEDLKAFGASVIALNEFDLIVGYKGITHLMEVKNPDTDWKLEPSQKKIINEWVGSPLHIITSSEAALNILRRTEVNHDS